jgi:beta-glucosidase
VSIPLDFRAFAYWHPGYHDWIAEEGEFEILIGASSADIKFNEKVNLTSSVTLPSILRRDSTLKEWMDDPRGFEALQPLMAQMMAMFGGEAGAGELMGMDMLAMISDMPLVNLGMFLPPAMQAAMPFNQLVDGRLVTVHGKG